MALTPWYRNVTLRKEVREGRSFRPDEFAIALEQVVAGTAPKDYCDPVQFFSRTCFTAALKKHAGMVLRRLSGKTENTSPVLTLITQFGGGKTHTLTSLYHLAKVGADASILPGVPELLKDASITKPISARVGVFVGNAWDPVEGRETPWIDLACQLAGDQGVAALGAAARETPPGTEALSNVFAAADAPVLLLFDEVLNFVNRHRNMAERFHAFIQNLSVAVTGTTHAVAVISLPRSQVEMTDWDQQWQNKITKVVRRVAQDLIANDESEISDVICRRLFEDRGNERTRKKVAKAYADWCFERTARLPQEWLSVDSAVTEAKAKTFLRNRFEACYPFHPSTLSVFQRKWRALSQFQQTRGALAMLAQWISGASREQFRKARTEPLITLGSAPLDIPEFRAVVLGQLGENRLDTAIEADLAGDMAHARALDADVPNELRDIHRRVGTAILFESSGGQVDKVAHLPELRFALGEPAIDTTAIDNAAAALDARGFFIRKVGTDGFRIHHQATLKKVVSDRRASLDEETEIKPAIRKLVEGEFRRGSTLPLAVFPEDSATVQDTSRLVLVILGPEIEWIGDGQGTERIRQWTKLRGQSPRLYPSSLVWCAKSTRRKLREKVEFWLAWKRVVLEIDQGILGSEFDKADRANANAMVKEAEDAAKDEVWASYRFILLADSHESSGLKTIDLGAGHSSSNETLCGRIVNAMKSEALLNESVGASYIDRHWPRAFIDTGAWPLRGLRQSFLDGSLTRLIDPETILRRQIVRFVSEGEFGFASADQADGSYRRVWYKEALSQEEITFESGVFLLRKSRAETLKTKPKDPLPPEPDPSTEPGPAIEPDPGPELPKGQSTTAFQLVGTVPPEVWNRLGTKIIPKLRELDGLNLGIELSGNVGPDQVQRLERSLQQILNELELSDRIHIKKTDIFS
ncbi:MAG: ATP-binding protein [Rhodothermaceae bacterium]|nr:ATP-binding protein [Rhodothermaceae bacterium]MYB91608.1 ATP-binding protein [Rhodothermaceae bacterium]MYD68868.1 ATP-binding protein [Rhodothermaceae bacterium]MYG44881.1 ATP-binding protein [Rhodothermaceae bacterium]MYJ06551.1 ATP-binding protein [Rhodothermaceae bacterium]